MTLPGVKAQIARDELDDFSSRLPSSLRVGFEQAVELWLRGQLTVAISARNGIVWEVQFHDDDGYVRFWVPDPGELE